MTISTSQQNNPAPGPGPVNCPVDCVDTDTDNWHAQISDVWNISSNTINEARVGFTGQLYFRTIESLGKGYPDQLGWQFSHADTFPSVSISDYYELTAGTNAWYKQFVFEPSDVVTLIRGKHIIHAGGELLINQSNKTSWGNLNAGTMSYTGTYTQSTVGSSTTGSPYADFLLGYTEAWSASVQPEFGARLKSPQMFIQDDVKLRPNLTLNLGLRYQIQHGWNEVKNNIRSFDPEVYNSAYLTYGAMWYASTHAHGRKSLQADKYDTFMPRVGFSWGVRPNTTVRSGIGLYSYDWSVDTYGAALGSARTSSGSSTDDTNGITPVVLLSGSGSNLSYISPTTEPTAYNGQSVTYGQFHAPLGKSLQWNFAVQRSLGADMVGEVAYVASHGFNLPFPTNINQIPESKLGVNDSPTYRPYPAFSAISGSTNNAISNYHSLQASFSKRMTSGISFSFNYTWSHFLDDQDSSGRGSYSGSQGYQNAFNPSANYGNSNFDVRQAFKGYMVYQLPFGRGQRFLNHNQLLDRTVGGWQVSGTLVKLTGSPFTPVVGGSNNSYSQAGNWYPNVIGDPKAVSNRNWKKWYNASAYAVPTVATFGNMKRNSVYGPGLNEINLSAGKTFSVREDVKLQIRADATNALNHPSFGLPTSTLTPGTCSGSSAFCSSSTNISSLTVNGRTMQLVARITF